MCHVAQFGWFNHSVEIVGGVGLEFLEKFVKCSNFMVVQMTLMLETV